MKPATLRSAESDLLCRAGLALSFEDDDPFAPLRAVLSGEGFEARRLVGSEADGVRWACERAQMALRAGVM